jgi:pimeloyl-ACP methyl ester carboxylesterase
MNRAARRLYVCRRCFGPGQEVTMMANGDSNFIRANGIDIHFIQAGQGPPLVLLHGGMVSANPIWAHTPMSYAAHMDTLARRYRVIAPDTRGGGRTVHDGGAVTFDQLAGDVLALVDALELDRPLIAGFSEGGITATIAGIRAPDRFAGIVNDAGYDMFNPQVPSFAVMRQIVGGSPTATEADPGAFAHAFTQNEQMRATLELLKTDQDGGQGEGHWAEYLRLAFHRLTEPLGYTFADLAKITAPALILVGDRDDYCTLDDGITAYRQLPNGEIAVVPGTGHAITAAKIELTLNFFGRHVEWS